MLCTEQSRGRRCIGLPTRTRIKYLWSQFQASFCITSPSTGLIVVLIKNKITAFLYFVVQLEQGTNEEGYPCVKLGRVVELKLLLIWKGEP